ncbi:MAG: mevalonate kinase, partial [Gammaproteobacteria bacterium]|nr:mevalonate kinase [Gammaproteobacteria bacterium]
HLLIDTCDAMGANLVNTICESIAPALEKISGGKALLKILSNYSDNSVCSAIVTYSPNCLANTSMTGEEVRDRIILASHIATSDVHRAVTSNKGIMNGIDALAIATGNDWRAIEASIHAFASKNGQYSTLTKWSSTDDGNLIGEIKIPIKPGIVGGSLLLNPAARLGIAIAGVKNAQQLSELMTSVGLAQNFAALKALVTDGIQKGHMRLHARSVASLVKTPNYYFDDVVERLVESNNIKAWKAAEILKDLEYERTLSLANNEFSAGKIILFGEHAAVYDKHALAIPIIKAVGANALPFKEETKITISEWGLSTTINRKDYTGVNGVVNTIFDALEVGDLNFFIKISSSLPQGMGLGSSAAIAVAIIRAVAKSINISIDNERINQIAFQCEKLAHGNPSGIDNTISCFEEPILFQKNKSPNFEIIELNNAPPLLIGFSKHSSHTISQVSNVGSRYNKNISQYETIFDHIDELSCKGAEALKAGNYKELGQLMNICHGLLNAIEISTPDLENIINIARENGASGAKLTGSGGGGSVVALCPDSIEEVQKALHQAGYETLRPNT